MTDRYCRACNGKNGEHFPPCTTPDTQVAPSPPPDAVSTGLSTSDAAEELSPEGLESAELSGIGLQAFDAYAVYQELSEAQREVIGPFVVSQVLDALVQLARKQPSSTEPKGF